MTLVGIDISGKYVIGCQSWGLGWGINGRFRLPWEDLGMLLENQGDAVTILGAR